MVNKSMEFGEPISMLFFKYIILVDSYCCILIDVIAWFPDAASLIPKQVQ